MSVAASALLPPLRDGDLLTSDEFMRRWEAMPDLKFAELIDGVVCMPSPVSSEHNRFHVTLAAWLATYADETPGCDAGLEATWLMGEKNVPQPDLALHVLPKHGGQSREKGKYPAGAPEFIVEVAISSRSRDLGPKLKLYEEMGVREYLIALPLTEQLIWNELVNGKYQPVQPDDDGIFRSHIFPGLWLDPAALWRRSLKSMVAVLRQGLATPEHAAFVARLALK
jgi:Uma2 family endonuclease